MSDSLNPKEVASVPVGDHEGESWNDTTAHAQFRQDAREGRSRLREHRGGSNRALDG